MFLPKEGKSFLLRIFLPGSRTELARGEKIDRGRVKMAQGIGKEQKKDIMKDIIRKLHEGLSLEAARDRFEKEIGNVTSTEIAEIEQGLMKEGISPEEIQKFCNVHALLFQSALEKRKLTSYPIQHTA
jgi:hypothetical protein